MVSDETSKSLGIPRIHREYTLFYDAERFNRKSAQIAELASETAHILGDALENFQLKKEYSGIEQAVGIANLPAGLFFLGEGVKDIRDGIKERDVAQVAHGIEHSSLGGASIIKGLETLEDLGFKVAGPATLAALGPVGSALSIVHGTLEIGLAVKELKDNIADDKVNKLEVLDALTSLLIGGAMIGGTVAGGASFGIALLIGLGAKLGIGTYKILKSDKAKEKLGKVKAGIEGFTLKMKGFLSTAVENS